MKKVLSFVKKCNGVYLISINEKKYHMHNWKEVAFLMDLLA